MKTISFILPYFKCGLRGILFESERGTENGDPVLKGLQKGEGNQKG